MIVQWTPEGRRLVTGASSGEFTLWNGLTFNFETILQVFTDIQMYVALLKQYYVSQSKFYKGLYMIWA